MIMGGDIKHWILDPMMPILDQCSMFMVFPFWMAGMSGSGLMLGGGVGFWVVAAYRPIFAPSFSLAVLVSKIYIGFVAGLC